MGLSVLLYAADVMCRVVPDLEALKYITPFYFSNAADIFVNGRVERGPALTGMLVLVISGLGFSLFLVSLRKGRSAAAHSGRRYSPRADMTFSDPVSTKRV